MITRAALFIAAPASGQGKTTVTAALARAYGRSGKRVRVFKTGPDFLDPGILQRATGTPVYNVDAWMVGLDASRALLFEAASNADLIFIEGAMGLYDGEPSSADLACALGVSIAAVIDASAMAQTFGALAYGLKNYRDTPFAGVIANRVAGPTHTQMLADSLSADIPLFAAVPRTTETLPERHLGLVCDAGENDRIEAAINALAEAIAARGMLNALPEAAFAATSIAAPERALEGRTIAVARDAAFAFIYPANLDLLSAMGARVAFFSPVADEPVPQADALWLPGGYPELHVRALSRNARWRTSIASFAASEKPILAECGGMMALTDRLVVDGVAHPMSGLIPGEVRMSRQLVAIGLQAIALQRGTLRGHTFHHSHFETTLAPALYGTPHRYGRGEAVYRLGSITASYVHSYFPSCPEAVAALLGG